MFDTNKWGIRARMGAVASAALLAAACSGHAGSSTSGGSGAGASGQASGTLTVWADAPRLAAVNAFKAAHPSVNVNVVTIPHNPGYAVTKISLANTANKGWPDVIFPYGSDVIPLATQFRYAAPLNNLVPSDVLKGFAAGSLDKCTVDGKLYCLRNDTGQTVLWYNATLMKQFGYSVPKTWAEYQQLGLKVGTEHPGYIVGTINGRLGATAYFDSSGCPTHEVVSGGARIDTGNAACTRVASLLQPLVDNGTLSSLAWSDPAFVQNASHILMMPAAAWAGPHIFRDTLKLPPGQIAAAPMPLWPGDKAPVSGEDGGGEWMISRHSSAATQKEAAQLIQWITTEPTHQVKGPTFPAYTAAAQAWCKGAASSGYYASDPCSVLVPAAGQISSVCGIVSYLNQWETTFNATVVAAAHSKSSLAKALPAWQSQLDAAAKQAGTKVMK